MQNQKFRKLEDWFFIKYKEDKLPSIFGKIFNDPRYDPHTGEFQNGHHILTSPVIEYKPLENLAITTSGSSYVLGAQSTFNTEEHQRFRLWVELGIVKPWTDSLKSIIK